LALGGVFFRNMAFPLRILREPISRRDLDVIAEAGFGEMTKAVVDIARAIMAVGGELHSDEEARLIDDGSTQVDLWGINLYPNDDGPDWIEFDSMINVRPAQSNRSRGVENEATRAAIRSVVAKLITEQ
jgi:hypothetical protein